MKCIVGTLLSFCLAAFASMVEAQTKAACATTAKIAAGLASHAAVLTRNCEVWVWGGNFAGGLAEKPHRGIETVQFHKSESLPPLLDIVVDSEHTVGISRDRRAYVWGSLEYLSCGGDFFRYSFTPQIVSGIHNVRSIAASRHINAYLTDDGSVYEQGCLKGVEGEAQVIAETPQRVAGLPRIQAVAVGARYSLALSDSGEVWAWGDWNQSGQLGTGGQERRAVPAKVSGLPPVVEWGT